MAKFLVFCAVLAAALAIRFLTFTDQKVQIPEGPVIFEATIKEEPKITDKWQVVPVGDAKLYTLHYPKYEVGERVRVEGTVENRRIYFPRVSRVSTVSRQCPHITTLLSKSLFLECSVIAGVTSAVAELRHRIAGNIDRVLPRDEAALVKGMVLGVDDLGEDLRRRLINTGTIHVVVVSGQNMAIVAGLFLAGAKFFGRKLSVILSVIAVFLYAALAGFSPPVIRAALMVLVSSVAVLAGRELWPIWSLFLAAYFIVFVNPGAVGEVSFQLTFAATLGILTLGKWLQLLGGSSATKKRSTDPNSEITVFNPSHSGFRPHRYKGLRSLLDTRGLHHVFDSQNPHPSLGFLLNIAAVPISAYIFTAPLIYFYFGRISLLAPFVNVIVSESVPPIMLLGFVIAALSLVFLPFAQLAAYLAYVPAWYFLAVIDIFSH